ncbi:hypothetical protein PIB30_015686 [Stylosanthes scabra]|uniref:Uncharacterized protein n=1 Tax=Stylosanthes scabra TaxID=79078 RepID=A0ABU6U635_9FABA|nr:hypothetical protein [Stylosanthes scabra]
MVKFKQGLTTYGFGYVLLWTKIFKHFNIDLSHMDGKILNKSNIINLATMHRMRRCLGHNPQQQEVPQEAQYEPQDQDQVHEHIGSSNVSQPSMLDLMLELQRINATIASSQEENQRSLTRMDSRLARMDRRITRVDRQMQGVYAHLGIPPQPQENEDEDEDQD